MRRLFFSLLIAGPLCAFMYFALAYDIDIKPKPGVKLATARCRDQTISYSLHRSGTCSRHGGVEAWLKEEKI